MAAERQAKGAGGDRAILGQEGAVGLEDAGGVIGNGAAVQQVPRLAVGVHAPAADHPRVEEIQAVVAGPVDLAVRFRDQHRLSLVDGDLRRTDLDLERHCELVPFASHRGCPIDPNIATIAKHIVYI